MFLHLHYCGAPRCPTCTVSGICLNSTDPALLRAPSVRRDFTCTISGGCTIQSAL
ncbi:unnamed protein product [Ectocarpus sp. CCAP 1310/34]|nr:unnamed protein product [Ectocarpus sp. CCAP 1310/34]